MSATSLSAAVHSVCVRYAAVRLCAHAAPSSEGQPHARRLRGRQVEAVEVRRACITMTSGTDSYVANSNGSAQALTSSRGASPCATLRHCEPTSSRVGGVLGVTVSSFSSAAPRPLLAKVYALHPELPELLCHSDLPVRSRGCGASGSGTPQAVGRSAGQR